MKLQFRVARFDTIRRARRCLKPGAPPFFAHELPPLDSLPPSPSGQHKQYLRPLAIQHLPYPRHTITIVVTTAPCHHDHSNHKSALGNKSMGRHARQGEICIVIPVFIILCSGTVPTSVFFLFWFICVFVLLLLFLFEEVVFYCSLLVDFHSPHALWPHRQTSQMLPPN